MISKIINIGSEIAPVLSIRKSAADLFDEFESFPADEILVDFKDVNFMSRAFAHEYVVQKRKSSKNISEIHLSEDAQKMIEIVSR
ncbi:hypothetical protein MsAg5_02960 [Methanosarcinaceae archaeon Ag5]|uniref:DUF4325 domain-containing protein n=1 Tax=Methanolapillus africanus TaxID=3028297 RepID=A0AAE4MH12_9EURY|nr:hypothetical protein [Methanosarcinaceae archaeon Ag5]